MIANSTTNDKGDSSNNTVNLSSIEVQHQLLKYCSDPNVRALDKYFKEKSFLEILGVERKENYHSNFLNWLFEDDETATNAISCLLLLLVKRCEDDINYHVPTELYEDTLTGNLRIESSKVDRETSIDGGRTDIIITINQKFKILIENKIKAKETLNKDRSKGQTEIYWDYYKKSTGNMWFVYLKPLPLDDEDMKCRCPKFVKINYQDLLNDVLLPVIKDKQISNRKQVLIREYIKSLSVTYELKGTVMAMDDTTRRLLTDFWENNKQLIQLALAALSDDPDLDMETQEKVRKANTDIASINRDNSKYSINDFGSYARGTLVVELAKIFLSNEGANIQDFGSFNSKSNIIIDTAVYNKKKSDDKRRWKKVENTPYYARVDWPIDNFKIFLEGINKIPGLEDIKVKRIESK